MDEQTTLFVKSILTSSCLVPVTGLSHKAKQKVETRNNVRNLGTSYLSCHAARVSIIGPEKTFETRAGCQVRSHCSKSSKPQSRNLLQRYYGWVN